MKKTNRKSIVAYLCFFPGAFLVISGILLLGVQGGADALFGMKGTLAQMENSLIMAMGIRQFSLGFGIILLTMFRQDKALGLIMLTGSIVPITDFIVFSKDIGWASALRHAGPVPLIIGLGVALVCMEKNKKLSA